MPKVIGILTRKKRSPLTLEQRRKISLSKKRVLLPQNGVVELSRWDNYGVAVCKECKKSRTVKYDTAHGILSGENRNICGSCSNKGKVLSEEHKRNIADGGRGEKNGNWKGGVTPLWRALRTTKAYLRWKREVKKRDGHKCVWCNATEKLHVDHIKSFALYPELRHEMSNGRTLCFDCHKKTENYGNRK